MNSLTTPTVPSSSCPLQFQQLAPGAQRAWLLAGNAIFTLVSNRTGARYTYKIQKDKLTTERYHRYHVKLLTGSDNEGSFSYLGVLRQQMRKVPDGPFEIEMEVHQFFRSKRSEYAEDSTPIVTFRWMWARLSRDQSLSLAIAEGATLLHAGRCGRCGRRLTVPESIESGYGPECIGEMGMEMLAKRASE